AALSRRPRVRRRRSLGRRRLPVTPPTELAIADRRFHRQDLAAQDRVVALRAGRHDDRADAAHLFEPRDVPPGGIRELTERPYAFGWLRPARHRLVNRFAPRELAEIRRKLRQRAAVAPVRRADVDRLDPVEDVEFRQRQAVETVDARGVADGDGVVPSAAPRTSGDGAVLAAGLAQAVAHVAEELRREGPLADARRIRLRDAAHPADSARRHAQPPAD